MVFIMACGTGDRSVLCVVVREGSLLILYCYSHESGLAISYSMNPRIIYYFNCFGSHFKSQGILGDR